MPEPCVGRSIGAHMDRRLEAMGEQHLQMTGTGAE